MPAARRFSSGIVTAFRFSALRLRPSSHDPQPAKSRYFWNPREAALPLKPTHEVA